MVRSGFGRRQEGAGKRARTLRSSNDVSYREQETRSEDEEREGRGPHLSLRYLGAWVLSVWEENKREEQDGQKDPLPPLQTPLIPFLGASLVPVCARPARRRLSRGSSIPGHPFFLCRRLETLPWQTCPFFLAYVTDE